MAKLGHREVKQLADWSSGPGLPSPLLSGRVTGSICDRASRQCLEQLDIKPEV